MLASYFYFYNYFIEFQAGGRANTYALCAILIDSFPNTSRVACNANTHNQKRNYQCDPDMSLGRVTYSWGDHGQVAFSRFVTQSKK